jgi:hypothetical protein
MLVHQSRVGAIIGRAGSKIKELREMTGSNLKVFKEVCPGSTDRILLITMEQSRMADTVDTIIEFLKEVLLYFFHQKHFYSSIYTKLCLDSIERTSKIVRCVCLRSEC